MNNELKPVDLEELSDLLELHLAADAARPQHEIDDELKRRGFDLARLNRNATEWLRSVVASGEQAPAAAQETVASLLLDAVLKPFRELAFYTQTALAGSTLATAEVAEEERPREIVLAQELSESDLRTRLPWAGPKVKVSKTVDAATGMAIYHAFMVSVNQGAAKTGALKIVLVAPDGKTAEARLQASERKKMFDGAVLPADAAQLRYALFIE